MNGKQVSKEHGWRDIRLSERHRLYGFRCPCVDIDQLIVEYRYGIPKALIEYKNEHAKEQDYSSNSYKALTVLANASKIPFFVAWYPNDFSWWKLVALNNFGVVRLKTKVDVLTEIKFVKLLYELRGMPMPPPDKLPLNGYVEP